jgi:uncharacterized membrane protein
VTSESTEADTEPTTEPNASAGLTPERVGFFTDAVLAIAMTLLVIEIPRPEDLPEFAVGHGVSRAEAAGNLLHFLYLQTNSYLAYVLAFYVLWNAWRSHHDLFDRIERLSQGMLHWHFWFLLLIGFLPYPTVIVGHHTSNPVGAALYTLAVGGVMICRAGLQTRALRDGLVRPGDVAEVRSRNRVTWALAIYFTATVVFAWWSPAIVYAWCVSPLLAGFLNRRRRNHRG